MNMCKFAIRFFCLLLCCVCIAFCSSCSESTSSLVTITDLNTPYNGDVIQIMVTDIQSKIASDDEILVGIQVSINNTSNESYMVHHSSFLLYVDDEAKKSEISSVFGESLPKTTTLAPGKKVSGYYYVNVPIEAKKIEVIYEKDLGEPSVIFEFDVSSVASVDSSSTKVLTLEKYNQIEIGMTYDEVKEIIGSDGSLYMELGDKGSDDYMAIYIWEGSGDGSASLGFGKKDAKLLSKSQYGLE